MTEKPSILRAIDSLILPIKLYFSWQVPFMAKFVPTIIFILYALLPTDIITDWLPIVGVIDDAAVLTTCAYLLVQMTPDDIISKIQSPAKTNKSEKSREKVIDIKRKK